MTTKQLTEGNQITQKLGEVTDKIRLATKPLDHNFAWGHLIQATFGSGEDAEKIRKFILRSLERQKTQLEVQLHTL